MEFMQIPACWLQVKLVEIASLNMGQSPSSADVNDLGEGIAFFQGKAEFGRLNPVPRKFCTAPKKIAESGDILLSVRAPVGPTNVADQKTAIGRGLAAIRAEEIALDAGFLLHYFRCIEPWMSQQGTGTTFKAVSGAFLKDLSAVLPPLAEQKSIAEKLDILLAQVENTKARLERIPKILKRFRQSVLAAAVSGKLTEEWRKESGQTSESLTSSLQSLHEGKKGRSNSAAPTKEAHSLEEGDIPCEWRIIDLERCCALGRPITYGILKPGPYVENGVIYLKVRDYPNDKLISDGFMRTSEEIAGKYKRSMLKRGDVLLSIRGTVGRVIIIPKHLDGANITQDSARISIDDRVSGDYIKWYLRSPAVQQRMERAKKGVAVKGINIGDVRALQVALPPIEEQTEIVRRVDQLFAYADTIETQVNNALERVNNLAQSILAKAFRGELTEQWRKDNPNLISGENSASALLEKIKAERAAAKPVKRGRKKA